MRVHELAKATQLESKEVIAIAKKHRIAIKPSPSANVEDKDIRKMMPLIDKFKTDQQAKADEERKKKEEERQRKEEERKRKETEKKKESELKIKADTVAKKQADLDAKQIEKQKKDEERKAKDELLRLQKEEEQRRRQEDDRLRSLGLPVPKRAANFRPRIAPPTPPPAPAPAPESGAPRPSGQVARPTQGEARPAFRPGAAPAGANRPGQGPAGPRPDRPAGQGNIRPSGNFQSQTRDGARPQGDRPRYNDRDRAPGQRPQGQGGEYRPRPQGQGGEYRPRPQGQGGEYRPRPQGQGGEYRPRPQGQPGEYRPRPQGQGGDYRPRPQGQGGQQRPGGGFGGNRPGGPGQRPDGGFRGDRDRQSRPGDRPGGGQRSGYGERGGASPQLTESNLPQIGVMRLDKPQSRRGDKTTRGNEKKPRGKVAPRKIFELDEDMTITSKPRNPLAGKPGFPPAGGFAGGDRPRRMGGRRPGKKSNRYVEVQDLGPKQVTVEGPITVSQFADKVGVAATEIIRKVLMDVGEALTINAILKEELIELIAPDFNVELEIIPVGDEYDVEEYVADDDPDSLVRRPPVVTIMGHVDHGKTSLLDYVRKSKVVEGEFGGITQHIGAYLVHTAKGDIVFLDTPGHEAFTSMRARGAGVTDLVILVVAANDGFMPQTIEAVHHAQAAKVPIVVAINKVDLPAADPAKVKQEALQHNLIAEEFGGETIFVEISAKTGLNVDNLLEMVALQAEILDLKANPSRAAQGFIIESHVDPNRGAVATVLVQRGTLRVGDHFVSGDISGRVRAMNNDRGRSIKEAGPSHPAEIIGLSSSPAAGETVVVVPDEQVARAIAERRSIRRRAKDLAPATNKHVTLENLHEFIEEGKTKDLNMIIKADVQGSVEAIRQSLEKIVSNEIRIRILHTAVGGINDSDVNLAAASDAVVIGFNVRPESSAQELANREGVEIKTYRIIYDLIEDVKAAMVGMLSPTFKEKILGHAEIRQVFRASRLGNIGGSYVKDGEIIRDCKVRVLRDNVVVYEGQLGSLRRVKEDVRKVTTGMECGLTVQNFNDIKEGDIIEAYEMEQIAGTLASMQAAKPETAIF